MSGSNQVRIVIELFCKILAEKNLYVIRAETLRQAKFNQEYVTQPLWKLLLSIVYFCKGDSSSSKHVPTEFLELQEEDVVFVKSELQKWGYLTHSFAKLPHDFSSGSRQLLLALGWLIHTQMFFDKIVTARSSPLQQELMKFLHQQGLPTNTETLLLPRPGNKVRTLREKIQLQLMLCGKLRLSLRRLYMTHQELSVLKSTIHKSTDGVNLQANCSHLSLLEVHLLRYPKSLQMMINELEMDNVQLKNLLDWKDKEHIFWEWMDSVLSLDIQETTRPSTTSPSTIEEVYLPMPEGVGKEITMARAKLRDFILQHEADMEKTEQLILGKKVTHVEMESLKHHLDTEVSLLTQRLQDCGRGWKWNSGNHESEMNVAQPESPAEIFLQHSAKQKYVLQSAQAIRTAKQAHVLDAAKTEILNLERRVNQLEEELTKLEKGNMQKLHTVIEKDTNMICIQPRYCKQFFNKS